MANNMLFFWMIVVVTLAVVRGKAVDLTPPTFSSQYAIMGVLKLPYADLEEPFTAYVDVDNKRSSISYYNDIVTIIQRGDHGPYGETYTVAPITTYKVYNEKSCFKLSGANGSRVEPQVALPDLTGFKNVGEKIYLDSAVNVWEKVEQVGYKKNTYVMWVEKYHNDPVRYEMMGYDTLFGSHYDKYIIDYIVYKKGPPDESHFDVPKKLTCKGFPGPGKEEHLVAMNPLSELLNIKTDYTDKMFEKFKSQHNKKYESDKEHAKRKDIFQQNLRFINSKNRAGLTYTLKVNHLADLTDVELKVLRGRRHSGVQNDGLPFNLTAEPGSIPSSKDWRIDGAVTPVKDQAVCGSCWSFGTTGTIEGAFFLKTKHLVRLSQQELVDCSWGEGNNGCDGGEDFRAYNWIMSNGGLTSEDNYGQYLAIDGKCKSRTVDPVVKLKGYVNVTSGSEDALKIAIIKAGPISVAIDASHKSLSFYANGVYYEPKCKSDPDSLDHAVLAVGYGELHGKPYWLIKNSWSTYWGNDGYVLISSENNHCGVTTSPTYVIIE